VLQQEFHHIDPVVHNRRNEHAIDDGDVVGVSDCEVVVALGVRRPEIDVNVGGYQYSENFVAIVSSTGNQVFVDQRLGNAGLEAFANCSERLQAACLGKQGGWIRSGGEFVRSAIKLAVDRRLRRNQAPINADLDNARMTTDDRRGHQFFRELFGFR